LVSCDRPGDELGGVGEAVGEERVEALKGIIRDLHAGKDMIELKRRFAAIARDVSLTEIAEMERQLIAEGLPEIEIKRLCDVHAQVLQDGRGHQSPLALPPDHPVETMRREARALARVAADLRRILEQIGAPPTAGRLAPRRAALTGGLDRLAEVEKHYRRKEYQFFPALEKRGIVAPPKVMWAIHDDVRALLKATRAELEAGDVTALARDAALLTETVDSMFDKEESIFYPMCLEVFTEEDWAAVRRGEGEFGYALIEGPAKPAEGGGPAMTSPEAGEDVGVTLSTGLLTLDQIRLMLGRMPFDVTFVDENDTVRYYSGSDRVFPRSPGVIGRRVQNCHPTKSVHIIQGILDAFRAGEKDVAEFWLELGGRFVHIRYFAMRDAAGVYKGVLEVVQDATAVRGLEGQRRLLDW
jgi:hypothetical protein